MIKLNKIAQLLWCGLATAIVLGLAMMAPLQAQVTGGTLTGVVRDAQGAVVPGATVTVTNIATGIVITTKTNSAGAYTAANLNPGNYQVAAVATGFSKAITVVTLQVGTELAQNFALKVGQSQQTVEVTAAAPQINTSSSTISAVVGQRAIVQLPLNGRDWASLATLQPGVEQVRTQEVVTQPGGTLRGLGMQMTISGARPTQNVYRLDGVIVNDYSNAGPGNVLGENVGVDAVQEFSVMTSNYSAQYGYTSGGVINAITKSGTNSFHGSAYEFIRNSRLDAANFFENASNLPKGAFRRNQFGFAAGGPLKKNKIFAFFNYEGLRQSTAVPVQGKVLTPDARLGIIPNATVAGSYGTTLVNPNGPAPPLVGPCPYPNMTNLAPGRATVCVDNTIAKLISEMEPAPLPGAPVSGIVAKNEYDGQEPVHDNFFTGRADFDMSASDTFHVSYYQDHSIWTKPNALNTSIAAIEVPHEAISLEETHVFTPNLINTVRVGYNRSDLLGPAVANFCQGCTDTSFGVLPGLPAPSVSAASIAGGGGGGAPAGFGGYSGAPGFQEWTGMAQLYDDISYIWGNHSFTMGFMGLRDHDNMINSGAGITGGSSGFSSVSDLLQNLPNSVRMPTLDPFTPGGDTIHHYRSWVFAGYLQDNWRMSGNFTLNLGVRYEVEPIMKETNNKMISLNEIWSNPTGCTYNPDGTLTGCNNLHEKIFLSNPTIKNVEPRIGFSWDPWGDGKTAVRGGFAVFDVLPMPYMIGLNPLQTAPANTEIDLSKPPQGSYGVGAPTGFDPTGYGSAANQAACNSQSLGGGNYAGWTCQALFGPVGSSAKRWAYVQPHPKRNYVSQWNLNIQHQFGADTALTVAYSGSRTFHNVYQTDTPNIVMPIKTSAGWVEPNPIQPDPINLPGQYSGCYSTPSGPYANDPCSQTDINLGLPPTYSVDPSGIVPGLLINPYAALVQSELWISNAWYNGLQVSLNRRMSHGLQYQVSFTWQKSLDTTSGSFAGDNFAADITPTIPWWDTSMIKGPSDFNVGKSLVANLLWDAPGNSLTGPAAVVAKGWQVGTIITVSTGVPLWPLGSLEGDAMGQLNNEPYIIPSVKSGCQITNPGSVNYLNGSCFQVAQAPSQAFYNQYCDPVYQVQNGAYVLDGNGNKVPTFAYPNCINLYGSMGRNSITGPGQFNMDFSLMKEFDMSAVSEGFHAQFRAEFFNVLNHTNFQAPTGNLESLAPDGSVEPGFGQITQTLTPNREIQFGLKLIW